MNRQEARKRAEALVNQMSVEEMASQLRFDAPAIEDLGIPSYNWWNETLHGVARAGTATMFPQAIGLGASFDPQLLFKAGRASGLEARAKFNESIGHEDRDIYKGITMWSPNINLFRDPRWGRGQETYGEDTELITMLAEAFIAGLQGQVPDMDGFEDAEDLRSENDGYMLVAACAKHFAVHSGPEAVRHSFDAVCSKKDLWETYLPQFEACVREAGVESVMGAYNRTNGDPCCAHPYLMKEILRGKWGFEGHFVSDCWALLDIHEHHKVTSSAEETVVKALDAGCDLNCGCVYQNIMQAYREWDLSEDLIREAAVRLFTTRILLGMFDKTGYDKLSYDLVDCPEHRDLAEKAALSSVVLLKNDGLLPLDKSKLKSVAVIGPNADDRSSLTGNYHGTSSRYITVLEGIEDYLGDDVRVRYASGCHKFKDREENLAQPDDRIAEAQIVAERSDLTILVLGLDETMEGEEGDTGNAYASGDKEDLKLPKSQRRLLEAIAELKKPLIVINMTGSAMDLQFADQHANAVLQAFYPGGRGGRAVAKILFGEEEPEGKLPVTFYKDLLGMPDFEDYSMKGRTYRYLIGEPLYPFGFGLGYGKADVVKAALKDGETLSKAEVLKALENRKGEPVLDVEVTVKNSGTRDAHEVLQIYAKAEGSAYEADHPHLAAFRKIVLKAGEEETYSLKIPARAVTVVNEDGERVIDAERISFYIGFGQPDERTAALTGEKSLEISCSFSE